MPKFIANPLSLDGIGAPRNSFIAALKDVPEIWEIAADPGGHVRGSRANPNVAAIGKI
jgi:hypothetical protein